MFQVFTECMFYVYNFCKQYFKEAFLQTKNAWYFVSLDTLGFHFPFQKSMTFVLNWLGSDVVLAQCSEAPLPSTASCLSDDSG